MRRRDKIEEFLRCVGEALLSALLFDCDGTVPQFLVDRTRSLPYPGAADLPRRITDGGANALGHRHQKGCSRSGSIARPTAAHLKCVCTACNDLRPDGTCEMPQIALYVALVPDDARRWLNYQETPDLAEIKPGSIAVHWRTFSETAVSGIRSRILLEWLRVADRISLKLQEFDGGVELRMADLDKGDAVRMVVEEVAQMSPTPIWAPTPRMNALFRFLRSWSDSFGPATPWRTSAQEWLQAPEDLLEFLFWRQKATVAPQSGTTGSHRFTVRHHARWRCIRP